MYNDEESYPTEEEMKGLGLGQDLGVPPLPLYIKVGKSCVGSGILLSNHFYHNKRLPYVPPSDGELIITVDIPKADVVAIRTGA